MPAFPSSGSSSRLFLKFPLNLCFVTEVPRDNGACVLVEKIRAICVSLFLFAALAQSGQVSYGHQELVAMPGWYLREAGSQHTESAVHLRLSEGALVPREDPFSTGARICLESTRRQRHSEKQEQGATPDPFLLKRPPVLGNHPHRK